LWIRWEVRAVLDLLQQHKLEKRDLACEPLIMSQVRARRSTVRERERRQKLPGGGAAKRLRREEGLSQTNWKKKKERELKEKVGAGRAGGSAASGNQVTVEKGWRGACTSDATMVQQSDCK